MPKRTKVGKHTRAQLRHFKTAEAIALRLAGVGLLEINQPVRENYQTEPVRSHAFQLQPIHFEGE